MAGQQLLGSAMIGEYFRDFAGYAAIALFHWCSILAEIREMRKRNVQLRLQAEGGKNENTIEKKRF